MLGFQACEIYPFNPRTVHKKHFRMDADPETVSQSLVDYLETRRSAVKPRPEEEFAGVACRCQLDKQFPLLIWRGWRLRLLLLHMLEAEGVLVADHVAVAEEDAGGVMVQAVDSITTEL